MDRLAFWGCKNYFAYASPQTRKVFKIVANGMTMDSQAEVKNIVGVLEQRFGRADMYNRKDLLWAWRELGADAERNWGEHGVVFMQPNGKTVQRQVKVSPGFLMGQRAVIVEAKDFLLEEEARKEAASLNANDVNAL